MCHEHFRYINKAPLCDTKDNNNNYGQAKKDSNKNGAHAVLYRRELVVVIILPFFLLGQVVDSKHFPFHYYHQSRATHYSACVFFGQFCN